MQHTSAPPSSSPHGTTGGGHEERDVSFRPIIIGLIGLLALLVLGAILMRLLMGYLAVQQARTSPRANPLAQRFARQLPPEPRLQTDPLQDLLNLHKDEDALLNNYAWVDRKVGTVRIPIERAMELLAERGLPARPQSGSTPSGGTQ
jgi:hypothetical protein